MHILFGVEHRKLNGDIMHIMPVSFGKVIAVTGKAAKIKSLNRKVDNKGVLRMDITSGYKQAMTNGLLGQAAKRGEKVEVYITGDDRYNLNRSITRDDYIMFLSANLTACYSTDILSVKKIASKILDEDKKND